MSYNSNVRQLGAHAEAQVAALYAAYKAGKLSHDEFRVSVVELMAVMMSAANQLADAALAALLTRQGGSMVVPVGTLSIDASEQISKAVETILADPADTEMQLRRLARSETVRSAQLGWGNALRQQSGVKGWTRQTHPGACDICQRLTGAVLPLTTPMYHHPGCTCVQRPVLMS